MFKQRLLSYLVDMLIITLVLNLLASFFIRGENYTKLSTELNTLNEKYINGDINLNVYINNQADITMDLDKENILLNIFEGFLLIGYFILLPYYNNGKTLGKILFKIKVKSDNGDLDFNKLIIRALIIDGIGFLLLSLGFIYILPSFAYFIFTNILKLLEFIILVISSIMIIKNENKKGIHDILSGTSVVSDY